MIEQYGGRLIDVDIRRWKPTLSNDLRPHAKSPQAPKNFAYSAACWGGNGEIDFVRHSFKLAIRHGGWSAPTGTLPARYVAGRHHLPVDAASADVTCDILAPDP